MKFLLRTLFSVVGYWLGGLVFFCIVPPLILPILTVFYPIVMIHILAVLTSVFVIAGVTWQRNYGSNQISVEKIAFNDGTKLPMGILTIRNIGLRPCENLCDKLEKDTRIENVYQEGNWIDAQTIKIYYDDIDQLDKAYKIAANFQNEHKNKTIAQQIQQ